MNPNVAVSVGGLRRIQLRSFSTWAEFTYKQWCIFPDLGGPGLCTPDMRELVSYCVGSLPMDLCSSYG